MASAALTQVFPRLVETDQLEQPERNEAQMIRELAAENSRLVAEVEQLRREREILKHTLSILADTSDGAE